MAHNQSLDFDNNVSRALKDVQLGENLRAAMGTFILKRKNIFPDDSETEKLRDLGHEIKTRALDKLPELLEMLENNCIRNNIQVHWAETSNEANHIVLDIIQSHGATRLVKGKSMVSEEMHLNSFLKEHGIEALETDLGEFIIQLCNETPSHIIVPAIHKSKKQIAEILHQKIPNTQYTEDVEELNGLVRRFIRRRFCNAEIGLSGVNFAIAETGSLCLVENEGNGRMCTTLPPVHIALMGLEKVIEKITDLPPLLRLLVGSATGQLITTYVNMITSPRKEGEKDGPKEIHLIILDNGRSKIYADPLHRHTLQCIRCGSCLNHCPIYTRIGGHAYGFVYPGPIGKILNPQIEGLKRAGVLATASSLCLACEDVCPVRIPFGDILRDLRNRINEACNRTNATVSCEKGLYWLEKATWKIWGFLNLYSGLLAIMMKLPRLFRFRFPRIGLFKRWTKNRKSPVLARSSLHELAKLQGVDNE